MQDRAGNQQADGSPNIERAGSHPSACLTLTTVVRSHRTLGLLLSYVPSLFAAGVGLLRLVDETPDAAVSETIHAGVDSVKLSFPSARVYGDLHGYRHRPGALLERGGGPVVVGALGALGFSVGVATTASKREESVEVVFSQATAAVRRGRGGGRVLAMAEMGSLIDPGVAWRAWEATWLADGTLRFVDATGSELFTDAFATVPDAALSVTVSAPTVGYVDFFVVESDIASVLSVKPLSDPAISVHSVMPAPLGGPEIFASNDIVFVDAEGLPALFSGEAALYDPGNPSDALVLASADVLRGEATATDRGAHLAFAETVRRSLRVAKDLRAASASLTSPRSTRTISGSPLVDRGAPVLWATLSRDLVDDEEIVNSYETVAIEAPIDTSAEAGDSIEDPVAVDDFLIDLIAAVPARHRNRLLELLQSHNSVNA